MEEATIDAYNESEQASGFFTMMEDNLKLPFDTEVLGVSVTVEKVDITNDDQIVAICARAGKKQEIPIHSHSLALATARRLGMDCRLSLLEARLRLS